MKKIINIYCSCGACPTQYEGTLEDGRMFYFRYRHGFASLNESIEPTDNIYDAVIGEELFCMQCTDDQYDGIMEENDVIELLGRVYDTSNIIKQIKI